MGIQSPAHFRAAKLPIFEMGSVAYVLGSYVEEFLILKGKLHEGGTAVDVELLTDVGAVMIYCAVADEQLIANLFAGLAFSQQAENAAFRGRERS